MSAHWGVSDTALSIRESLVGKTALLPALPGHIVCDGRNTLSREMRDAKQMHGAKQNPT